MVQLTISVQYPVTLKGWRNGKLTYDDTMLAITAEDGSTVFQASINDIVKVRRYALALTFYTTDSKQSISLGDMRSYMANTRGGRSINRTGLNEAEQQISTAEAQMEPLLNILRQHGIPIRGSDGRSLIRFEKKAYYAYFGIIILGLIALGWVFILRPLVTP